MKTNEEKKIVTLEITSSDYMSSNEVNSKDIPAHNLEDNSKKLQNENSIDSTYSKNRYEVYQEIIENLRNEYNERRSKGSTLLPLSAMKKFHREKVIGTGYFGSIHLTFNQYNNTYYAMKCIRKETIVKKKRIHYTLNEKVFLESLRFPFILYMEFFFMDNSYLYFVMPLIKGGDLFAHLKRLGRFKEVVSKFYASQVLLAIEFLHFCNILYRDLKPENILLNTNGYLMLGDLGFCKTVVGRTYSICGTPEYIAPEILLSKGYGKPVDWWSFGVLVYEMRAGFTPFVSGGHMQTYRKIINCQYDFPSIFTPELKDLVKNLVVLDLTRRYGCLKNGIRDIKDHKWFENIDFLAVYNQQIEPPYKPVILSADDTSYFEKQKQVELQISEINEYEDEFKDF